MRADGKTLTYPQRVQLVKLAKQHPEVSYAQAAVLFKELSGVELTKDQVSNKLQRLRHQGEVIPKLRKSPYQTPARVALNTLEASGGYPRKNNGHFYKQSNHVMVTIGSALVQANRISCVLGKIQDNGSVKVTIHMSGGPTLPNVIELPNIAQLVSLHKDLAKSVGKHVQLTHAHHLEETT